MYAIETRNLRKEFGDDVVAVAGIDLAVKQGEMFGFLGPNGAGKTTTVRMLTTLLRPTSGDATVGGFDLYRQPPRDPAFDRCGAAGGWAARSATGLELLELQARLFGLSKADAKRRSRELIELVGLVEAAERQVKTYSGGMKRRLDLASALVHTPRLLFLDEPTEGLDPASRAALWVEVQRLNREHGVTVFLTTHYLEEADRLTDRLAIIDRGKSSPKARRRSSRRRWAPTSSRCGSTAATSSGRGASWAISTAAGDAAGRHGPDAVRAERRVGHPPHHSPAGRRPAFASAPCPCRPPASTRCFCARPARAETSEEQEPS